jgi:hypothetical protein
MLQELIKLLDAMKDGSENPEGWSKIEPLVSTNEIVILNWPAWKLKIVAFKMPKNWDGTRESANSIESLDNLYWDQHMNIIWRTHANEKAHDWSKLERCTAAEVVDTFLTGDWSPPWKCSHCLSRMSGKYKPRF